MLSHGQFIRRLYFQCFPMVNLLVNPIFFALNFSMLVTLCYFFSLRQMARNAQHAQKWSLAILPSTNINASFAISARSLPLRKNGARLSARARVQINLRQKRRSALSLIVMKCFTRYPGFVIFKEGILMWMWTFTALKPPTAPARKREWQTLLKSGLLNRCFQKFIS